MARRAKAMTCQVQVTPVSSARAPTTTAAMPNQRQCTPGRTVSRLNSSAARMNQFQAPKPARNENREGMGLVLVARGWLDAVLSRRHAAVARAAGSGGDAAGPVLAKRLAGDLG